MCITYRRNVEIIMADAKLTPRQLVDVLHRLEAIETHSRSVRQQLIEAMANRRRAGGAREGAAGDGEAVSRKRPRKNRGV